MLHQKIVPLGRGSGGGEHYLLPKIHSFCVKFYIVVIFFNKILVENSIIFYLKTSLNFGKHLKNLLKYPDFYTWLK
jgi:hypothetical protein